MAGWRGAAAVLRRHRRWMCTSSGIGQRLRYYEHGDPRKVLQIEQFDLPKADELRPQEALVAIQAAPINPADINQVEGVYPRRPTLPAVGGNEGAGRIVAVGSKVSTVAEGDLVIPRSAGWGTWQTHAILHEDDAIRVPGQMNPIQASMLAVNPCTAYRMLTDFGQLEPGDSVIQNGANSAVGLATIQLCRSKGIHTINVIRDHGDFDDRAQELLDLGATKVISDAHLTGIGTRALLGELPRPKLGLNCVGGKSSLSIAKFLAPGGYLVTYGGMSRRPVTIPTGKLIFDNIRVVGFWMTRWNEIAPRTEREEMLRDLAQLVDNGDLQMKSREWPLDDAIQAIECAMQPQTNTKEVILFGKQMS